MSIILILSFPKFFDDFNTLYGCNSVSKLLRLWCLVDWFLDNCLVSLKPLLILDKTGTIRKCLFAILFSCYTNKSNLDFFLCVCFCFPGLSFFLALPVTVFFWIEKVLSKKMTIVLVIHSSFLSCQIIRQHKSIFSPIQFSDIGYRAMNCTLGVTTNLVYGKLE